MTFDLSRAIFRLGTAAESAAIAGFVSSPALGLGAAEERNVVILDDPLDEPAAKKGGFQL